MLDQRGRGRRAPDWGMAASSAQHSQAVEDIDQRHCGIVQEGAIESIPAQLKTNEIVQTFEECKLIKNRAQFLQLIQEDELT